MSNSSEFRPNWASAPGDTIADVLKNKKLSLCDFAKKMDSSVDHVKELIHGFISINSDIAKKLESALGASAEFWINRELQYRHSIDRLKHTEEEKWIKELPIKDMKKFGWLDDSGSMANACLSYFNVPDVWVWRRQYSDITALTAFRKSSAIKSNSASIAAWLRQGELQAKDIVCSRWNADLFRKALNDMRQLAKKKKPSQFLPLLKKSCADCGVCLVIAPTPSGCAASGATKFINSERALMLMSFRYLSDDHFWFTFFHEAGHLVLHGDKQLFMEGEILNDKTTKEEKEANQFSSDILIPIHLEPHLKQMAITEREIKNLAIEADIPLGIIVGQLQHLGRISFQKFNSYKRRYSWDDILQ